MALTCKEIRREVSDYLDNTMPLMTRKELELHLGRCRPCAAIVDGVRNLLVLAADERIFTPPAGFSARLRARLKKRF